MREVEFLATCVPTTAVIFEIKDSGSICCTLQGELISNKGLINGFINLVNLLTFNQLCFLLDALSYPDSLLLDSSLVSESEESEGGYISSSF